MERFKAVEKAMKTKAYSKEGLSAQAKLDPKEKAKVEAVEFLATMVDELEQQIESLEAENESIQATMKKGKNQSNKADRIAAIEHIIERHKWHQGKLELIRRSLENGGVEPDQVKDLEESIRYYVSDGMTDDFMEDEELYDDLDLQEEEDAFGMNVDGDRGSSQDAQSVNEDVVEAESRPSSLPAKTSRTAVEPAASAGRRPSAQLKSPLPTLATLHNPLTSITNGSAAATGGMKPASLPTRPAGEGLKYASAAAAAAASDKNNLGISPLPPPPGSQPVLASTGIAPLPISQTTKTSATSSPITASIQPAPSEPRPANIPAVSTVTETKAPEPSTAGPSASPAPPKKAEKAISRAVGKAPVAPEPAESTKRKSDSSTVATCTHICTHMLMFIHVQLPKRMAWPMVSKQRRSRKRTTRNPSTTSLLLYKTWWIRLI